MSVTCTLGAVGLTGYLRDNITISGAEREWDEVGGLFADIASQVNVRSSALIDIVIPLAVTAADADALITVLAAIRAEVGKDTNTLVLGPTGATNTVTFNIVKSPHMTVPWTNAYDVGFLAIFDLVLVAEPWARGDAVTAISVTNFTLPDGLTFLATGGDADNISGDSPTPLSITIIPNSDADLHNCYIGWYPSDTAWTGYLVETDTAGTWVGGTVADAALSNEHDSASCKNTSASYSYYPVDTAAFASGAYLVVARVAFQDVTKTGTFKLSTAAGDISDEVTFTGKVNSEWELIELGTVHLPAVDVSTGVADLLVNMKSSDGAKWVAMDYVAFIPVDNGLCMYHPTTNTVDASSLIFVWGKTYVDHVVDYTSVTGHGIKAVGNGTLVVVAEHVSPNAATYDATITVSYTPRYELWR